MNSTGMFRFSGIKLVLLALGEAHEKMVASENCIVLNRRVHLGVGHVDGPRSSHGAVMNMEGLELDDYGSLDEYGQRSIKRAQI
jgi:hypothetical protein